MYIVSQKHKIFISYNLAAQNGSCKLPGEVAMISVLREFWIIHVHTFI